jgi:hypothetical protein
MISLILILILIITFLILKRQYQFVFFSIAALFPLTLGGIGSIPSLLVIEWIPLVTFLFLINQLVSVKSTRHQLGTLKFRGIEIFIFALLILITWIIISYINNEILAEKIRTDSSTGIKRTYFNVFNNVLIFFTTIIFFASQYEKISVEKFLKSILYITLLIGFIRLFTFYFHIKFPLFTGFFAYSGLQAEGAQRFAGLDVVAMIGISAQFSLYVYKNKLNFFILLILLIFLFLSGGRTPMVGVVISSIIFSFLFLPKNFIYLIFIVGIFFLIAIIFLPDSFFEAQITRLSTFKQSGFMGMDEWRGMAWNFLLKNFMAYPIFGKGISDYSGFIYTKDPITEIFVRRQLFSGGHGAYFSLLGILGIGGITYFVIMVYGGIILSFKKIKRYATFNQPKTAISIFCFMMLIMEAVYSVTGPNGLSDIQCIFYIVGLICAIRVMENVPEKIQDKSETYLSKIEVNKY